MTHSSQLRLILGLAALTCVCAIASVYVVTGGIERRVSVEGAFGVIEEAEPTKLDLHLHLVNLNDQEDAIVGVSAPNGAEAELCGPVSVGCGDELRAKLASQAETSLTPDGPAYVRLASAGRPFREGETVLIELELASGERAPIDVMVRRR